MSSCGCSLGRDGMAKRENLAIILVIAVTVLTTAGIFAYKAVSERDEVILLAQSPDQGNWTPQVVRLDRGRETAVVIRNVDVVSHGFYAPALNIVIKEIKAGEVKELSLTIDEPGEYPFYCVVWCSDLHMLMRGVILVR